MQQLKEWLDSISLVLFLSFCGGVALAAKKQERSLFGWVCICTVAVFSGMMAALVMDELKQLMPVSENLKYISVSLAAFSGGRVLEAWTERLMEIGRGIFGSRD